MFWKRNKNNIDHNIGKTVIKFKCDGCMGHIHNFEFIGTIIEKIESTDNIKDIFYYLVRIEKDNTGFELRNDPKNEKIEKIPSWYLQKLEGDYFIIYD